MDCGLGNLDTLKRELLLEDEREGDSFDASLSFLGLGVLGLFEAHCDRSFARAVRDKVTFSPDTTTFCVPRYPIECVASVELRSSLVTGFLVQAEQPQNFARESGLVYFGGRLGYHADVARITWTGGYFIETREPSDDGFGAVPENAEALPAALQMAWVQQARWFWERADIVNRAKAGFENQQGTEKGFFKPGDDLLEPVKIVLNKYRRMWAL